MPLGCTVQRPRAFQPHPPAWLRTLRGLVGSERRRSFWPFHLGISRLYVQIIQLRNFSHLLAGCRPIGKMDLVLYILVLRAP